MTNNNECKICSTQNMEYDSCSKCSLIKKYFSMQNDTNVVGQCAVCPRELEYSPHEETNVEYQSTLSDAELLLMLARIPGAEAIGYKVLEIKDHKLRQDVVDIIIHVNNITIQMTKNGQRYWSPINNTIKVFFNKNDKVEDCIGQSSITVGYLSTKTYNYNWEFSQVESVGHVWGIAVPENPNMPYITFDTRSRSFEIGGRCNTCSGYAGLAWGKNHAIQDHNKNGDFITIEIP